MNNNAILFDLLIGIFFLQIMYSFIWCRLRDDYFRSKIRIIRDELFDWMVDNKKNFNDHAYVKTRRLLNNIICASSCGPIMLVYLFVRAKNLEEAKSIIKSDDLDLDIKLDHVMTRAINLWIKHAFTKGSIGLLFKLLAIFITIYKKISYWKEDLKSHLTEIIKSHQLDNELGSFDKRIQKHRIAI